MNKDTLRKMADVMYAAEYDDNGCCTNVERRNNPPWKDKDEKYWRKDTAPNWDWYKHEYRIIEPPIPRPLDYNDMTKRLKDRKDMHVISGDNGDVISIVSITGMKWGREFDIILGGNIPITFTELADTYLWFDTGLPCVKE